MPNPLYLKLMRVSLEEYNTYSAEKKARFQTVAQSHLAELHSTDMEGYIKLVGGAGATTPVPAAEPVSDWEQQSTWETKKEEEKQ